MPAADQPTAREILAGIWQRTGLPNEALDHVELEREAPTLPSSFRVADAATTTVAAAALAAGELWHLRSGSRQTIAVNSRHAEAEFLSENRLRVDGEPPGEVWGPIASLYQCGDKRWVRIHANYPHHEAGVLKILGCARHRDAVAKALESWTAQDFEDACGRDGLVVFMLRTPQEWAAHPQGAAVSRLALFDIERIGDAPPEPLPEDGGQPLSGITVLDLTRVIAGPVCGRTLATHGADVTRVSAARLPRDPIMLEIDGGRGKHSCFIDLKTDAGRSELEARVETPDVFVQGYRPGAIDAAGFPPDRLAQLRPGIVSVAISAWSHVGPWAHRRGFDSLVQTASGINWAEAEASGCDGPKPLPCQAIDFASGHLMAMGAMAALHRRATEGGSWHVRIALARTGHWLKSLGRIADGFAVEPPSNADLADVMATIPSGYGALDVVTYPARMSKTPPRFDLAPQPYPQAT